MALVDELTEKTWCFDPNWLAADRARELLAVATEFRDRGEFKLAGVGRAGSARVTSSIRRDEIRWLERGLNPSIDALLDRFEELRTRFNTELFAGLIEFEAHFAYYPPGGFYQRHVDRFHSDDTRTISGVLYLNPDWKPANGGQLRLYVPAAIEIEPRLGTLALFQSASVEHEVTPSEAPRWSVAVWFKRRRLPVSSPAT